MSDITYLFGAGASNPTLPLVNELPVKFLECAEYFGHPENKLSENESFVNNANQESIYDVEMELARTLREMSLRAIEHASIDTYAKKLSITGEEDELLKLKAGLICSFIFWQKEKSDSRYDSFFASLIDSETKEITERVKILSWNYDCQFEKAYSYYSLEESISANQSRLNIFPKDVHVDQQLDDKFAIYKLNGTTALFNKRKKSLEIISNDVRPKENKIFTESIVKSYFLLTRHRDQYIPGLTFAWEKNNLPNNVIKSAIQGTVNTQVLVVIGYSFPFFNREIDRQLLNRSGLKKVYFQAPDKEPEKYALRFL